MENSPQAYGIGRVSGQVDFQQFLQSKIVLCRILCLKFSIIAYFCISPGSKIHEFETNKDVCIFSKGKESICYIGVQVSLLGIVEAILLIVAEYMLWKTSSVKMRGRIVKASVGICGSQCVFCALTFLYMFFNWVGTSVDEDVSTANPNFAILFIFAAIFMWGYSGMMDYERMEKGVDPNFMGDAIGNEGDAQFRATGFDHDDSIQDSV